MMKVFLAEDEFVIREGIKNSIDWNERGYDFCGEASDGELAFSMIQKNQPDILITDIKMPFMDGLTLSRMVKAQFPWIEIILLTGYEDFTYAKEAIRIGVASYLSKPISGDNLLREVDKVAEKIVEKNKNGLLKGLNGYIDGMKEVFAEYEHLKSLSSEDQEPASEESEIISEVDPRHIDSKPVRDFLRRGEPEETRQFMRAFFDGVGQNAMKSTMLRQYIAMDVYFCVADYVETELLLDRDDLDETSPAAKILADKDSTCEYLTSLVNKAIELRKQNSPSHYRDVVNEVYKYIDEHYSEDELSLNDIAAVVNFSPNHLSAVFKQQTGQTLIKYLTDYRMDKAKHLLDTTTRKSNEIGLMVGYKDPHYFSFLFKKTQGVTPTQYRAKAGIEEG